MVWMLCRREDDREDRDEDDDHEEGRDQVRATCFGLALPVTASHQAIIRNSRGCVLCFEVGLQLGKDDVDFLGRLRLLVRVFCVLDVLHRYCACGTGRTRECLWASGEYQRRPS